MSLKNGVGPATDRTVNEARKDAADSPSKPQSQNLQARTTSWRDRLKIHPAAELFPLMSADELRELGEDIKKNGLRDRVAVIRMATRCDI